MTASTANGFAHVLYTPNSGTCQARPTRSTPSTRPRTRGETPGRPTPTTWPCPMRSATSRTAWRSTQTGNCTSAGAQDRAWTSDDAGCVPGTDPPGGEDQRLASPSDEDFDGSRTATTGQARTRTRPLTGCTPRCCFIQPADPRQELLDIAFETTCRASTADSQPTRRSATGLPAPTAVNPPAARRFYPSSPHAPDGLHGQEGGRFIRHGE